MKDCFSTMRLWTVSLMTLGAVVIQCPAQAQSIGSHDGGKTRHHEGPGHHNRGSRGGNSTPSVTQCPTQSRSFGSHDRGKTWRPAWTGHPYLWRRGGSLIQCPVQSQSQSQLNETYDGGNTWYSGPNRGRRGGGSPPSVSPEEARRQDAADKANQEGNVEFEKGNWDASVQAYERALQNWDHEIIRNNLTNAKEQARLQRERVQRDAAASASIKQSVDHLVTVLGNQSATGAFDSPTTGTPRPGGRLDFITDPAAVLSKPTVSNTREPNADSNVVDLRDAKAFTVDPARVKGAAATPVPQQQLEFLSLPTPNSAESSP